MALLDDSAYLRKYIYSRPSFVPSVRPPTRLSPRRLRELRRRRPPKTIFEKRVQKAAWATTGALLAYAALRTRPARAFIRQARHNIPIRTARATLKAPKKIAQGFKETFRLAKLRTSEKLSELLGRAVRTTTRYGTRRTKEAAARRWIRLRPNERYTQGLKNVSRRLRRILRLKWTPDLEKNWGAPIRKGRFAKSAVDEVLTETKQPYRTAIGRRPERRSVLVLERAADIQEVSARPPLTYRSRGRALRGELANLRAEKEAMGLVPSRAYTRRGNIERIVSATDEIVLNRAVQIARKYKGRRITNPQDRALIKSMLNSGNPRLERAAQRLVYDNVLVDFPEAAKAYISSGSVDAASRERLSSRYLHWLSKGHAL